MRRLLSPWVLLPTLLLTGWLALAATPAPVCAGEDIDRQKQIADIEKQIADLTKKLNELKAQPANPAAPDGTLPADWVPGFKWRCIGPASMGGRITAIAVNEKDSSTYWIATASGGLLKTTNNGTTWEHQFDHQATVSIGDVAVSPSNPNVLYIGTGEANPRNSVSWGDGVYRSTDGGKTWENVGLKDTFQIGKIAIHPTNPDIVYVGALGRLYGPNEERGLYKTTDGGKHWDKAFYLDENTGIIDVQLNPANPEVLLVAAWERRRDGFDSHPGAEPMEDGYDSYDPSKKWGAKAGIYRSTDGGKKFDHVTKGLPSCELGRIGLDWYHKDPSTVFAIIDSSRFGMGTPPTLAYLGVRGESAPNDGGAKLTEVNADGPAGKAGLKAGDVLTSFGDAPLKNYDDFMKQIALRQPDDKVKVKYLRDKEAKEAEITIGKRPESGEGPGQNRGVFLGVGTEPLKEGLKVTEVTKNSSADKAGVLVGDVLLVLDKTALTDQDSLVKLLRDKKPGDKVTLTVQRGQDKKDLPVTLEGRPRRPTSTRPWQGLYGSQVENAQDLQGPNSHEYGGIYRSDDLGATWKRINSLNPRPMYFSTIRVDPSDSKHIYVCGVSLYRSADGGKTFSPDGGNGVHPDQHCLWIDPKDGRHMLVGTDGGFYATYDRMTNWDHLNLQSVGQFYHVAVDNKKPYNVYGGLQDNGSWGGPSRSLRRGGLSNEDWIVVGGGDGFMCRVDGEDPDIIYWSSQDGNMHRRNIRTNEAANLKPTRGRGQPEYRFNWNTPFITSAHNPRIFYSAGDYVFRSVKRGDEPKAISPEITRTKRGSATALAESPKNPDVLYVGTDDGNLLVTRDGGVNWTNLTEKLLAAKLGLKGPRWVNSIEPSRQVEGRVYVVLDGHRSDEEEPHVYVSEDFGQTWKSLRANLPVGCTRVLREDPQNPKLLYLGTEFNFYVSLNRGESWTKLNNNLPTVAIHEVAIADEAGEIVAATHGRGLWILDVSALRQMKPSTFDEKVVLFKPNTAIRYRSEPARGSMYGIGSRHYFGENPTPGAALTYALKAKAEKAEVRILDIDGKTVRRFGAPTTPGLHRVSWDMARLSILPNRGEVVEPVAPGMYRVVLAVDGTEVGQSIQVEGDPLGLTPLTVEDEPKKPRPKFQRPED